MKLNNIAAFTSILLLVFTSMGQHRTQNKLDSHASAADQLTISSVKIYDSKQKNNIMHIAGGSLDATIENWKQDTSVDVSIYADNDDKALITKSIPLEKFTYAGGKLSYKGSAPLTDFHVKIWDKTFTVIAARNDLKINQNITLEISLGNYLGKGTGNLTD